MGMKSYFPHHYCWATHVHWNFSEGRDHLSLARICGADKKNGTSCSLWCFRARIYRSIGCQIVRTEKACLPLFNFRVVSVTGLHERTFVVVLKERVYLCFRVVSATGLHKRIFILWLKLYWNRGTCIFFSTSDLVRDNWTPCYWTTKLISWDVHKVIRTSKWVFVNVNGFTTYSLPIFSSYG